MTMWVLSVSSVIALGAIVWMFRQRYDGNSSKALLARYGQTAPASTQRPLPTPEREYLEVRCTACNLRRRLPTMVLVEANSTMTAQLQAHYTKRPCQTCGQPLMLWVRRDIVHHTATGPLEFSVLTHGKRRVIDWKQTVYEDINQLPEPIRSQVAGLVATSEDH